jgi:hypothetical protein
MTGFFEQTMYDKQKNKGVEQKRVKKSEVMTSTLGHPKSFSRNFGQKGGQYFYAVLSEVSF